MPPTWHAGTTTGSIMGYFANKIHHSFSPYGHLSIAHMSSTKANTSISEHLIIYLWEPNIINCYLISSHSVYNNNASNIFTELLTMHIPTSPHFYPLYNHAPLFSWTCFSLHLCLWPLQILETSTNTITSHLFTGADLTYHHTSPTDQSQRSSNLWHPFLCCLLYTLHLCTHTDPRCVSTSTKFGMSRSIGVCDRVASRYSQPAHRAPRVCPLDGRHETLCTSDQHQFARVLCTPKSTLP